MQPLGPSDVDADSIDVWVVSHGGVASNALCDHMQSQGLRNDRYARASRNVSADTPLAPPPDFKDPCTSFALSVLRAEVHAATPTNHCFGPSKERPRSHHAPRNTLVHGKCL